MNIVKGDYNKTNTVNPLASDHPLNTLTKPISQESPIDYIKTLTPDQAVEATALVKAFWEKQKKQL